MIERHDAPLAELTTLRVGGPAARLLEPATEAELVGAVAEIDAVGEPLLLVAGGSNLLIADDGFAGTVVRIATEGVRIDDQTEGKTAALGRRRVRVSAAAGELWDAFVARCLSEGLAGLEPLSGIPGSVGATPIQNVGAYGAEVAESFVSLRAYDRQARELVELDAEQCRFGYRTSVFKRGDRYLVLAWSSSSSVRGSAARSATGSLPPRSMSRSANGRRAAAVRAAVLGLRASKGMILDPGDPDSVSAGSFFTNPILEPGATAAFRARARLRLGPATEPPAWPEPDGRTKLSAAWLIERAGYGRGFGGGRAGISSKHALALINRGGASAAELIALAREIRDGVEDVFGVSLSPEPTLIGTGLE